MHFVSSTILRKALRLAEKEGVNAHLLSEIVSHPSLINQEDYVPIDLLFRTYEIADEYLEPGFSIRQGKQLQSEDYGTLGLSWRTCWYAKDIFYRLVRFMVLVTDHGSTELTEREGELVLKMIRPTTRRGEEMANETAFVMFINVLKEVCENAIYPTNVQFNHASDHEQLFRSFFTCSTEFNAGKNALFFKVKDLETQTLKADQHISDYLLSRMEEEQKDIQVNGDYLLKGIQNLIRESLPSGIPSLIQVADHVKLSPRTLKRRLAEKSFTFRELVQQIQKETSLDYLKRSDLSISEIAFLTGFSELSAFNRAFKRWYNQSPSSFRNSSSE